MQLRTLLNEPMLQHAIVAAGAEGTLNQVTSVNMMDERSIIEYVKKDELLLMTGEMLEHAPDALVEIVNRIAKRGGAGLAIRTSRFLKTIPQVVIEKAESLNFPIIELPLEPSLGDIYNVILKVVLQESSDALTEAMDIHRRFTDLMIAGKGLYEVVDQLAKRINAPVILLDYRLNLLEASRTFNEQFYYDLAFQISEIIRDEDLDNGIEHNLTIRLPQDDKMHSASFYPVQMNLYQKGYLILLMDMATACASERLAVEQAMNVISFELMKLHAVEQQSRLQKNEFMSELAEGHYSSAEDIARRGERYGLKMDRTYICTVCRLDDEEDLYYGLGPVPESDRKLYNDSIYEQMQLWMNFYFDEPLFFSKGDLYISLIPRPEPEAEDWLLEGLRTIQQEMEEFLYLSISFGVGNPATSPLEVPDSYRDALETLTSGYRMGKKGFIKWTDSRGVMELLRTISPQKLREFYQSTLKSLAESKRKEDEDLVETMTVYIEHNGQIADTAKALFVHRNTVIYRLKKCEERLHVDLKNAEDIHKLRTALLVRQMID